MLLSCAHHEPPPRESDSAERIEVKEEGTWRGQLSVTLAFRPLLTAAAHERLTPEESRAFVEALEEALEGPEEMAPLMLSRSWREVEHVTDLGVKARAEWFRIFTKYTEIYGAPTVPLPDSIPDDKFFKALTLSVKYMPEGVRAGAAEFFSSRTVVTALVVAGITYLALWLAPEPVFTKSTATIITISLMALYGVAEIINLSRAFMRFYEEVNAATTLAELEAAARRFGESMGQAGVRIMTMVAGGVASRAAPYASLQNLKSVLKMPTMFAARTPQGQVVMVPVVEATATVVDVAKGTAVLMGVSAVTTAAAGKGAMASARTTGDCRPKSKKGDAPGHHIATDKNTESAKTGGPWTPRFELLFARAGMTLQDPANIVYLMAHQGPHPEAYHREIYRRLEESLMGCATTNDCRQRLVNMLDKIASDICAPGSRLNKLLKRD
jgi:hypothetical protein